VKPLILVDDSSWGMSVLRVEDDLAGAQLTTDPERLSDAHVVVFHLPTAPNLAGIPKYPGQIWVAVSKESHVNLPCLSNLDFMRRFDLTMTYRLDSDIPVPYLERSRLEVLANPPLPKTARSPAVYFASNPWDRCGRTEYVRQLMQSLPVDSYGACLNNCKLSDDRGTSSKLDIIAGYKFTLAFENSICRDYVTEKFFHPLIAGSVPVYRGAPNVHNFAPGENCYIDAARFSGPRELAEYLLALDKNETEYQSYLHWKRQPLDRRFLEMVDRFAGDPIHRLCAKLSLQNGVLKSGHVQRDPMHQILQWLASR